jgi:hypothetical protein
MKTTNYSLEKIAQGRKDFHNWFKSLDQRRGTTFLDIFPEMTEFYNEYSKK